MLFINGVLMRKLATIDVVEDVRKHPDADTLDIIIVRGWQIISKSGNFKIGVQQSCKIPNG